MRKQSLFGKAIDVISALVITVFGLYIVIVMIEEFMKSSPMFYKYAVYFGLGGVIFTVVIVFIKSFKKYF